MYHCNICNEAFETPSYRDRHQKLCINKCEHCDGIGEYLTSFKTEGHSYHRTMGMIECPECKGTGIQCGN